MNRGVSFLLGERALKKVDDDGEQLCEEAVADSSGSDVDDGDEDPEGCKLLALCGGNWSCLRRCIRLISSAMLAAICSETN